jgi:hypothetical protein
MTKKWHSQVGIIALTAAMLAGCSSSTDATLLATVSTRRQRRRPGCPR